MASNTGEQPGNTGQTDRAEEQSSLQPKIVAFIPARAGSRRIKGKNIKSLGGHPLIAHTIEQAHLAGVFDHIYVSTDSEKTAEIAKHYGADVITRPAYAAHDGSPDYVWVLHALEQADTCDAFAILRPTNPFRRPSSIVQAWELLKTNPTYDSVRAVRPVKEHPLKMWRYHKFDDWSGRITPFLPQIDGSTPSYDMPTQSFDLLWVQTGALQVHWAKEVRDITGDRVMGILLDKYESIDLNTPDDWEYAEWVAKTGKAHLMLKRRSFWKWLQ